MSAKNGALWIPAVIAGLGIVCLATALPGDEPAAAPAGGKLAPLKRLVGEWVRVDEDGRPTDQVMTRTRLTAGGSAILEVLFPDTDHEMVTVYHLDGDDVVLTHYCTMGNAPRMKLRADSTKDVWIFVCDGTGANMEETDPHMHQGTIRFLSDDHVTSEWTMHKGGEVDHSAKFDVVRKKESR